MTLTRARAEEILAEFSHKRVLVVGDVMLDRYIFGRVDRVNPEAPALILNAEGEKSMTGGAGNVAKNAGLLGASTTLISVVGADQTATKLRGIAEDERYQARLVTDPSRPTTEKIRHVASGHQLLRVDYEETHELSREAENALLSALEFELEDGVDAIIISDYAKGVITKRVAHAVLVTKKNGVLVAADVKVARAPLVAGASLISPNRKEACEFLGLNPLEHRDMEHGELARRLSEHMNAETYVTLSADGIAVSTPEYSGIKAQEHAPEVTDVSGAGDTVITVLTLARLAGATPEEATELANAAGAIVVGKVGAVGVTRDEILSLFGKKKPLAPLPESAVTSHWRTEKIRTLAETEKLSSDLTEAGATVVALTGSFDLLHAGHLGILEEAKRQGDVLVVGLNSDLSVRDGKGDSRPVIPEQRRAAMLAAIACVDYVVIVDAPYREAQNVFLRALTPQVYVNASEYGSPEDWIEFPLLRELGIRPHVWVPPPGTRTSDIIRTIQKLPE